MNNGTWTTQDGRVIPIDELTDHHVCNIVTYFGKQMLYSLGYKAIVERYLELEEKYDFFKEVK